MTTLNDLARPSRKAFPTNATTTVHPSLVPTVTEPSGVGVVQLAAVSGGEIPRSIIVVPYGVGAEDSLFNLRLTGWRRIGALDSVLWVPTLLAELTCDLGTTVGVNGSPVSASDTFIDDLTIVAEPVTNFGAGTLGSVMLAEIVSAYPFWFMVPLHGCEKVQFTVDLDTATSGNALYALV